MLDFKFTIVVGTSLVRIDPEIDVARQLSPETIDLFHVFTQADHADAQAHAAFVQGRTRVRNVARITSVG